jgi:hypothetical protein
MHQTVRPAGHVLALLLLSLTAFTPTMAQSPPYKYGYCDGLAGNPRVTNYTRLFVLGPSSPPGAMSGFLQFLHKNYGGYTTPEIECRTFTTAAEAETQYRKMLDGIEEHFRQTGVWPPVEIDWLPEGGSALSGAAARPAPAPPAAPVEPKPPAPAAAPATSTEVKLDRWGKPIPTSAYWFCNTYVQKKSLSSAPFVANTLDRSPQEMYEQFLAYLNKNYHESGNATCNKFATQAEIEARIAQIKAEAPGRGEQFAMIEWTYVPGGSAAAAAAPAAAKPAASASGNAAPAPAAAKPAAPAPATPAVVASKPAVYVFCRSEWNTDRRRYYNPPVDGRGAGYPEWQASFRDYLVQQHAFKGSNVSCGKYLTKEAAQADYDQLVANARATPTVNGQPSPIIITSWTY